MRFLKILFVWLIIATVIVVIEKKTGLFTWILTAGGRFNNPLVTPRAAA